jgi:hypothetical protein
VKPSQNAEHTIDRLFSGLSPIERNTLQSVKHINNVLREKVKALDMQIWTCRQVVFSFLNETSSHFGIHCEAIMACLKEFLDNVSFEGNEDDISKIKDDIRVCYARYCFDIPPYDLILSLLEFGFALHRSIEAMLSRLLAAPSCPQGHV